MHRCYFYLTAFISITTMPVSALAEIAADLATTDTQSRNQAHTANDGGFYIDLPSVDYNRVIEQIRTYQASLTHREEVITVYLDENRLSTKDVLITAIMHGGLLYAAVRQGNLGQAKDELAEIADDMDELSRDLLVMQAAAGELTVAQLQ